MLAGLFVQKVPMVPLLVMPPLFGSLVLITLQKIRGQGLEVSEILKGFNYFLPLLFASVVIGVFVFLGFLFLIIPGIIISAFYIFTVPLIVDRGLDFWQAMEQSRLKAMEDIFGMLIFSLMLIALIVLGAIFLGVGLLVTMPIAVNTLVFAYLDLFGEKAELIKE
jgi:uncharacterized membrane protein